MFPVAVNLPGNGIIEFRGILRKPFIRAWLAADEQDLIKTSLRCNLIGGKSTKASSFGAYVLAMFQLSVPIRLSHFRGRN
jgi:hypothetical protein